MQRAVSLSLVSLLSASFAASLVAQSNTVPGLDGRLEILDNITYWGRRGPAYPGGEVGLSMRNTMCNPGSVSIPWYAQMAENHPKFGFLITRLSGDRMEQISDRSYCKHAFTSASGDGGCGTCNGIGGSLMGVHCSDTYSAGHNAGRSNLGPPAEINPWLGTWNHIGSYFDQGDPNVGAPGNTDGVGNTINVGSDPVKNRVTVKESDLLVPGASYFYGIQLIHEGEALANRWDNIKSRGFQPTWSGSTWNVANTAVGEAFGSILQHWPGATVNSASNGNSDGRFFVAAKVTALGGGNFHYEYAVHNVDNSRAGATFRVPIEATGVASNFSFRDIDSNPLNNWTAARVGNEIVFTAPASNPLEWNTIYNFGFDCNVQASTGLCVLDEARVGAGALSVAVTTKVPSGVPGADYTLVGTGCGSCVASFYESPGFDLANTKIKLAYNGGAYSVGVSTNSFVAPTGGDLNMGDDTESTFALPFTLNYPGGSTTTLRICSNGFISPGASNGTGYTPSVSGFLGGSPRLALAWRDLQPSGANDVYAQVVGGAVHVTWLNVNNYNQSNSPNTFQAQFQPNGDVHLIYQSMTVSGSYLVGWTPGGGAQDPGSSDISAGIGAGFAVCGAEQTPITLGVSNRPVLNTTIDFLIGNLPASSQVAVMALSITSIPQGFDLGPILDMQGCFGYGLPDGLSGAFPAPAPGVSWSFFVPNLPVLIGQTTMFQSLVVAPGFTGSTYLTTNGVELLYGPQ
ncbi:MAG: hypothetical protein JNM25_04825 [Planctomycetes bacterium]|nr:hypothetical protein [Planctomycetota bacterium]